MPLFALPEAGGVRLVFKHWPICTSCNPTRKPNSHPAGLRGGLCPPKPHMSSGGDAASWRMHDLLFAKRDEWIESKDSQSSPVPSG
jgi:hypothetical protein